MPQVPRYNQNRVQESAGPNIRMNPGASESAFGAGPQIARTTNAAFDFVSKVKQEADQTVVKSAYTEYLKSQETSLTDPEVGFMNMKGRNAIDAYNPTVETLQKSAEEIQKKFNLTGAQVDMYRGLVDREAIQTQSQLNRHLVGERRRYGDETQKALIETEVDSAIKNFDQPDVVEHKLQTIEGSIMEYGNTYGQPQEAIDLQRAQARSGIRSGVVNQFLNKGDDRGAQSYFEQHKDSFTAEDRQKIEKVLEVGYLRGESQRVSDQIFSESQTLGQAFEKVRKIEEPKLRDEVMQRTRQNFQMRDEIKRDQERQRSITISNLLDDHNGDIDKIPAATWDSMTASEKESWRRYGDNARKGVTPETDWKVYTNLRAMAGNPETREKFMSLDIYSFRPKLGNTEYKEMVNLWEGSRGKGTSTALEGIVSDEQIFSDGLRVMNLNPKKDAEEVAEFRRIFNQKVQSQQDTLKRKLSDDEKINIRNNLMPEVITKKGFFFDTKKRAWEIAPDENVEDVKLNTIPRAEIEKIKSSKAYKANPTDAQIVKMYKEVVLGK